MTAEGRMPQIQSEPGEASAEDGFVVLDGPDSIAVTMTVQAAAGTGRSLLAAAEAAGTQIRRDPDARVQTEPGDNSG